MSVSRRSFLKIGGVAGIAVYCSADGFSFELREQPLREIEDPIKRLKPLRAPKREIKEVVSGFLWIDAGQFNNYGGWELNMFHTDLAAASGYLLANRFAGPPVEDAVTAVQIPSAGTWYIWVRTRNWLPEYSPGKFKVLVNGKDNGKIFGSAESDRWIWESGGACELPAGKIELRIQDLTGHLGRISAVILTRDADYRPPTERDAMVQERSRLSGISLTPVERGHFDVIVVGGGPAGVPAAVAAARSGCLVALIHDRPVLGGNASLELLVPPRGAARHGIFDRETGVIEDIRNEMLHVPAGKGTVTYAMEKVVANEPNLSLFLNENVDRVDARDGKIQRIYSRNTLTGECSAFSGAVFVDCTGDGWLGYYAGAEYRLGREAQSEFNEAFAPKVADKQTMSGSLSNGATRPGYFYHAVNRGVPVGFVPPEWAVKIPNPERFMDKRKGESSFNVGASWIEYPGSVDDLYGQEEARDYLYRITVGVWDFFKNHWADKEQAANWALLDVPTKLGMRETRRLVGDHILNQNEVETAELFPDRVAYAGWTLDVHHPDGVMGYERFTAYKRVPVNHIPYRSLYSKNIENLLFAGRNGSFSAVALGAVRVELTCVSMGQAAGTAAALCVKGGCTPRGLYQKHLQELQQQLLKDDQYIIGLVNEDPADRARDAKNITSSGSMSAKAGPKNVINGIARPFEGKANCWESRPLSEGPQWIELELSGSEEVNTIQLTFDTGLSQMWKPKWKEKFLLEYLVKSYSVSVYDGQKWHSVGSAINNYQRHAVCRFPRINAEKNRVTVAETRGAPSAKIYEVRAYNEPA